MSHSSFALARRFGCLAAAAFVAVDAAPVVNFPYAGPQSCPADSSVLGYVNTTTLAMDMILIGNSVATGKKDRDKAERVYTLCPHTTFRLGEQGTQLMHPLFPVLENSVIQCGYDGKIENECVLSGGHAHVIFEDDFSWLKNVTLKGIRFQNSESVSVFAIGHPVTDMRFVNCEWKFNSAGNFVVVSAWDENLDVLWEEPKARRKAKMMLAGVLGREESRRLKKRLSRRMRSSNLLSAEPTVHRGLEETGEGAMHTEFVGCKFVNNEVKEAILVTEGGSLEIIGSTFQKNKAFVVVASISNSALSIHSGSSFYENEVEFVTIFSDSSSALIRYDEDTTGDDNVGIKMCQGVFVEAEGSDCLSVNNASCDGYCCEFGDTSCAKQDQDNVFLPPSVSATKTKSSTKASESADKKCAAFCIALAVIVPTAVLVIAVLAYSAYRTKHRVAGLNQNAGEGGEGCELQTKTEQPNSIAPGKAETASADQPETVTSEQHSTAAPEQPNSDMNTSCFA